MHGLRTNSLRNSVQTGRFALRSLTLVTAAASLSIASLPAGAKEVTWKDILRDEKTTDAVVSWGMGVRNHRYSPLDTINTANVDNLKPVWSFSFGDEKQRGQETQALLHDGTLYITASYSRIFALDAKTGRKKWSYSARLPEDIRPCCDVVNRGAALYGDKVYFGTLDAAMVALNKDTGKPVWRKKFADHSAGYTMTGAPTIVRDKKTKRVMLIHGSSGDEFGVVGRLYARDPDSGEEIWMRPLVEGHMGRLYGEDSSTTGDPSAPSWPNNPDGSKVDAWNHGGGAPWQSATYDVKTNTIVVGTGNPAPWNTWYRSDGDNWQDYDSLYTSGQVYIEPSTGEPVGFFQHTPNDAWDFSGNNPITLFEMKKDGKTIRAGAHADRNGFFFVTDLDYLTRRDGKISKQVGGAIGIYPFVPEISWATGWDVAKGRPYEVEGQRPPPPAPGQDKGKVIQVTPNFLGGTNWMPMAYSRDTQLFYIPSNDWSEDYWTEKVTYKKGSAYLGQGFRIKRKFEGHVGVLRAIDPTNGKIVWEHKEEMPLWAGVVTTAGGLVFTGTSDGFVKAFHAETGEELWRFQTGSGVVSQPIVYEVDGEQYLALASGYGGAVPLWGGDMAEMTRKVSQGGSFWVFALADVKANLRVASQ